MTGFRLGYGTNGFANHRLDDALRVIADLGYTVRRAHAGPPPPRPVRRRTCPSRSTTSRTCSTGSACAASSRPARATCSTRTASTTRRCVCDEPERRIDFLDRAVRIAAGLGADCVSFWSGIRPSHGVDRTRAWRRMRIGVGEVLEEAVALNVPLGPRAGAGHVRRAPVRRAAPARGARRARAARHHARRRPLRRRRTRRRRHLHPPGRPPCSSTSSSTTCAPGCTSTLSSARASSTCPPRWPRSSEVGYTGVAAVELPRHSHAAPVVAARAIAALRAALVRRTRSPRRRRSGVGEQRGPSLAGRGRAAGAPRPGGDRRAVPRRRPQGRPRAAAAGDRPAGARARHRRRPRPRPAARRAGRGARPAMLSDEVAQLYRYGDDAERRGVLRGLAALPAATVPAGLELVKDALRANDIRLVAAAMGDFAARHLDAHSWRHGVLKCLFVGVPLAAVADAGPPDRRRAAAHGRRLRRGTQGGRPGGARGRRRHCWRRT